MKNRFVALLLLELLSASLYAQSGSINNTLGSGGTFTIKDGSTTFLTLGQSTGYLSLNKCLTLPVTTSSSVGVIFKGANRFIHDYTASGTTGNNTFVGLNAGNFTMSGTTSQASNNTAVGSASLTSLTTGQQNSALGASSLYANSGGYSNSAFGYSSLYYNSSGGGNAAFGTYALYSNTASYNSAFGYRSLSLNTTGWGNSAFGDSSLYSNTTGVSNSAFGSQSLRSSTTGNSNSAFGNNSLSSNQTGAANAAFGNNSLYSNTIGIQNSAFAPGSLSSNTTGNRNSAFGYLSLLSNTAGQQNSAFGESSLIYNTASGNSAFGSRSLCSNTTGIYNVALGDSAGYNITSGNNNTCIGYKSQASASDVSNEITLGDADISTLRCQVVTITALSDARDKKNIRDLSLGLEFLMGVKPRQFNWDRRDWYAGRKPDGSKVQATPTAGFIAQELEEVQTKEGAEWLNLVLKSNPDRLEATPGNLLPIMVKAIQELKAENDALKARLARLEQAFASATDRIRSESSAQHTESRLTQE